MPMTTMAEWRAAASWRKRLDINKEGFAPVLGVAQGPASLRCRADGPQACWLAQCAPHCAHHAARFIVGLVLFMTSLASFCLGRQLCGGALAVALHHGLGVAWCFAACGVLHRLRCLSLE